MPEIEGTRRWPLASSTVKHSVCSVTTQGAGNRRDAMPDQIEVCDRTVNRVRRDSTATHDWPLRISVGDAGIGYLKKCGLSVTTARIICFLAEFCLVGFDRALPLPPAQC